MGGALSCDVVVVMVVLVMVVVGGWVSVWMGMVRRRGSKAVFEDGHKNVV